MSFKWTCINHKMTASRPKPSASPSDDSAVGDMNLNGNSTASSEGILSESVSHGSECVADSYTKMALTRRQTSIGLENGADSNDPGKMFIGGLNPATASEGLRDYFQKFGDIKEVMIMRDPITKRSRGFGFVTFTDPLSVEKVLESAPHMLDSKRIDPKLAVPRKPGQNGKLITRTKRVFIGGVATQTTNEELSEYFGQYGKIETCELMMDKATNRHRGFGFVTFESEEAAEKVCEVHFHDLQNKMVEAKKAVPKEVMGSNTLLKQRHQYIRAPLFIPVSLVDTNIDMSGQLACLPNGERENATHFMSGSLTAAAASYALTAAPSPMTPRQPGAGYAVLPGYYLSPGECPLSQPLSVFLSPTALLPPYPNVISMS